MEFRILGPLEVAERDEPLPLGGRRQRMVLAVLALSANEVVSTDRLIAEVWGDDPPASARKSLQAYISRLRALLGPDRIESRAPGYALHIEPSEIDTARFSDLASRGRDALESDPEKAATALREALAMWRGAPLADLGGDIGTWPDIVHLEEQRLAAVEDRIEADLRTGRHANVIGELESFSGRHPMRERLRGQLMLAMYRSGRQADALRVYQETRRFLAEELGIDPSPALQRLEDRILAQDPALAPVSPAEPETPLQAPNPYKGLNAFGEEDAANFFGRDLLIAEMLERLGSVRFLAVVGPSGSGKSSAVRAGLLPALRSGTLPGSERWTIASMLPGAHPFEELQASLVRTATEAVHDLDTEFRGDDLDLLRAVLRIAPSDGEVVVVVDQFEELFLLVDDELVRRRFITNLVEAIEDPNSRLRVVVTLRADHFDHPLEYPDLARWLEAGQLTVPPLDPVGLERAAVQPAMGVGTTLELELAALMVSDVSQQPGALPLFQYALTELFDRRDGPVLTVAGYRALGGLEGALRSRADEIFASLSHAHQQTARQIFLRMVTFGEGGESARRRVRRSELDGLGDGSATVLERFSEGRLLTFDRDPFTGEPTVEPAHDSLLREWPRLAGWIEDARDDLRIHRTLITETQQWLESHRHEDYLAAGARLALFEHWRASTTVQLSPEETEYLETCVLRRQVEAEREAERLKHERRLERRSTTRLRVLVAVMALAAITGGALAAYAVGQQRDADRQRTAAQLSEAQAVEQSLEAEQQRSAALLSETRVLAHGLASASIASLGDDPQLSLLLALHAVNITARLDEPVGRETVEALHWAFQLSGGTYPIADGPVAALPSPLGKRGVYILPIDDLAALAHGQVTRQLTPDECAEHLLSDRCPELPERLHGSLVEGDPIVPTSLDGTTVAMSRDYFFYEKEFGFRQELEAFGEQTGIGVVPFAIVDFEGSVEELVATPLPDVAGLVQPGFLPDLVGAGLPVELSTYLDVDELERIQSPYLVGLGSVATDPDGPSGLYGAMFLLSSKSVIWYPDPEFRDEGYEVPDTWEDLIAVSDQLVADGYAPWCWGEFSAGFADGWPGTDWIEDLVLRTYGPEVYDDWVAGRVPFTDPRIEDAFERLGDLVFTDGYLYRGREGALLQFPWIALTDMAWDPPQCWLHHYASIGAEDVPDGARTIPTPATSALGRAGVVGGGEMLLAFSDRPEVRAFVRYVLGPDFGRAWADGWIGFISARSDFDEDAYTYWGEPNELIRPMAASVRQALLDDSFRFDGSDLMPVEVGREPFWSVMVEYIAEGPDNLTELLQRLDAAWPDK